MANFGELVLLLGDLHIPHRSTGIPDKFRRMLVPNKMQHLICTGNVGCKDTYEQLRSLAPNIHIVSGDFEAVNTNGVGGSSVSYPETKVIQVGQFRIGVIHGHQVIPFGDHKSLAMIRRKLDVDILVNGHTHKQEVVKHEGHFHINPGSITGAYSSVERNVTPSFILLAIQGTKVVCYVYELIDGEVDVSKTEFNKGDC